MSVSQNSSLLLSVALLFMIQLLLSTRAAPISCKNNSRKSEKFKNCAELYKCGQTISGVYTIDPADGKGAFNVYCDQTTDGGGWTVIQKRVDDIVDFNRTWKEYKNGFGDFLIGDFWLGLEKIQRLTQNKTENKLRVDLGVTANKTGHAEYEWFGIETADYKLRIGSISASATVNDSLSHHNGKLFGTWDRPSANSVCAPRLPRLCEGWSYLQVDKVCTVRSNLNKFYPPHWGEIDPKAKTALSTTQMKIRQKDFIVGE
ncbi:angiopoietin-related protein 7-like [Stylophora pistillata]|uniref:angiopoietin-related protein 7-like n=1 Tax=Stylophora pistillata TaxID=50429 RepID=UPI000C05088F|nr:angiopoietin-related protein 7-like [Stylophora pistillata]